MNHRYVWYHVFDFIRLQVPDKMPFDIFRQTFVFSCHFLHFAFSKNTLSRLICFFYRFIGMEF